MINDTHLKTIIDKATVARLATVDSECKPHLIPVVFVFDNDCYFIPIDEKTKQPKPENLKRVKNIQQNPNVALLIDEYNEDWTRLYFIIIQGKASKERIITLISLILFIDKERRPGRLSVDLSRLPAISKSHRHSKT